MFRNENKKTRLPILIISKADNVLYSRISTTKLIDSLCEG